MSFKAFLHLQIVIIILALILSLAYNIRLLKELQESNAILAECINQQNGFREQIRQEDIERYINKSIEKELK
ncbi:Uncharacterised protein [Helicobacter pullorum]|uniref:hypothetical protein n=1 Tax=Helicobacter pullorum TaxID=35818 RepID=UPI000F6D9509|nr:hypothetical protein [Helicobacter pullorum]VEJ07443.1 Uncharacterised protein [Helicobacter pullorum]